jgi:hypothetical protein
MDNQNLNDLNIDDNFLRFNYSDINKIIEKIQNNRKDIKLKDYIDFNEIFKDLEKKDDKDVLPNFLNYDIIKKINEILDRPYSTIIYADPEKKSILAHMGTLMSFFSYYSVQLRYLYKTTDNKYLKELIKRVLAKNDGYLNMAIELYKIETSIYIVKDNQITGLPYQFNQNQNYGIQYQNK